MIPPLPNVLFLLLSRQKKVYRQGSALHAPTLRPWDSIFNFMFYVCQPWVLTFNINACANSATVIFNFQLHELCQPYNLIIMNNLISTLLEIENWNWSIHSKCTFSFPFFYKINAKEWYAKYSICNLIHRIIFSYNNVVFGFTMTMAHITLTFNAFHSS